MDVYSYGMIGYEILTRKTVCSNSSLSVDLVEHMIKTKGQKPDTSLIDEVGSSLEENSIEFIIFQKLEEKVYQCWQTKSEDRPKISEVKKQLDQLAQRQRIYDCVTDKKTKSLAKKLKPCLQNMKKSSHRRVAKPLVQKYISVLTSIVVFGILVAIASILLAPKFQNAGVSCNFLAIMEDSLVKYDICNHNFITLVKPPKVKTKWRDELFYVKSVVKVKNMVYVISWLDYKAVLRANLSNPSMGWKHFNWDDEYKYKLVVATNNSILAAGTRYNGDIDDHYLIRGKPSKLMIANSEVHAYNITTDMWHTSVSWHMNDDLVGNALVTFKSTVCAVGGSFMPSVECFNASTTTWHYLPPMKTPRRNPAAVELNGELCVIGGTLAMKDRLAEIKLKSKDTKLLYILNSVEKFNPETNAWTEMASVLHKRKQPVSGVCNGKIYVLGGEPNVVESYDPQENIWKNVTTLSNDLDRHAFFATSI